MNVQGYGRRMHRQQGGAGTGAARASRWSMHIKRAVLVSEPLMPVPSDSQSFPPANPLARAVSATHPQRFAAFLFRRLLSCR